MAQSHEGGEVKAYNHDGELIFNVKPFGDSFTGGINVACGDIDGDGISEIVVAQVTSMGEIKAYKYDGTFSGLEIFSVTPFRGLTGVNITTADYDGDNQAEIIVAEVRGGKYVKVYKYKGNSSLRSIFKTKPFGRRFKGGINIATGDINGDGKYEIILSQASKGGKVKVFGYKKGRNGKSRKKLIVKYRPFGKGFKGGINIAAGKFSAFDTNDVIAMAPASNGGTIWAYTYSKGFKLNAFFSDTPFGPSYEDGINLTMDDIDSDNFEEIIATQAFNGGSVKGYKDNGTRRGLDLFSFTPFDGFTGGINTIISD